MEVCAIREGVTEGIQSCYMREKTSSGVKRPHGGNVSLVDRRRIQLELLLHCIKYRMAIISNGTWTSDDNVLDDDIYRLPLAAHNVAIETT